VEIARGLGVTLDWLVTGREPMEPTEPGEPERKLALIRRILDAPPDGWSEL
jgi:hypothetical protein